MYWVPYPQAGGCTGGSGANFFLAMTGTQKRVAMSGLELNWLLRNVYRSIDESVDVSLTGRKQLPLLI
ncbi:hypothetical protein PDIP_37850 [Penicillium digitatum Pd1]|uniref:Uncharacterized protein n=1 Tax=Penicillium digitatum (strain Pd1 / CECT 20795) TaxID=1170230 RepID=K9GSH8_PEND1|nr:hypothetical protein PDIP_37850 [Penicillium digitatum Pd1]EKV16051.1 hypothetical protein PDIP_37850 [Penicillium digitatum Pd1]